MNTENGGLKRLWAPWRMRYIDTIGRKEEGCVFCTKPAESDDLRNQIVFRSSVCYVVINLFPYNNGHLLVVPYRHIANFHDLTTDEHLDLCKLVDKSLLALKEELRPDGFNVGMNLGRSAGAGIDQHLHMHIVPRWNGDTNFMPVLANTKVISESLDECCSRLRQAFL